ncbi:MAG: hypothetical protein ABIJ18_03530 [archaeon]
MSEIIKGKDFENKVKEILKDGAKQLHVVADFDRTLTGAFADGMKFKSTYSYIREGGYLGKEFSKKSFELFDEYYPYESSTELVLEEKKKKMQEWWEKHFKLMVDCDMNINVIKEVIKDNNIKGRKGFKDFLEFLNEKNIPLLIFSAGLGDMIVEFLKTENHNDKNIHIIANFFKFDKEGKAFGHKGEIIHMFSKKEYKIEGHDYEKEIKDRKNVILLGDSIGDAGMADGMKHDLVLKIGFLNEDVEKQKEEYLKYYDLLILNDGTMEEINTILKRLNL